MIHGSVDNVSTKGVVGWIHSSISEEPLKVEAIINNRVIGEALADLFRPDLAAANFGSGNCGFEILFQSPIDVAYIPFVETRLSGGTLVLPRTAIGGFNDYLSSLYSRYPHVGRYASVLGGQWTDRSDATALLKARTDMGKLSRVDSGSLSRFIAEGLIIVGIDPSQEAAISQGQSIKTSGLSPHRKARLPAATDSDLTAVDIPTVIARGFFQQDALRLIYAILEDHPIVVKSSVCATRDERFSQISGWEDLASPAECLGLVLPMGEGVSVEILRGSHRFPEFDADGVSRWTVDGRRRVAEAALAPNIYTDAFSVPAQSVAILGSGLIHRVYVSASSHAIRVLVLPSHQGSVRFRQQVPSEEVTHSSGARIWI